MPACASPSRISSSCSRMSSEAKSRECLLQQGARIQIADLLRPAGAVGDLLGAIALHEQEPARPERLLDAGEDARPLIGAGELDEDRRDHVELRDRPRPVQHVRLLDRERDAAARRQLARLGDRERRELDRAHVEALLGEEHAVAAFAVGDRQRRLSALEQVRLALRGMRSAPCRNDSRGRNSARSSARARTSVLLGSACPGERPAVLKRGRRREPRDPRRGTPRSSDCRLASWRAARNRTGRSP